jgi:hypothetical protein
MYKTENIAVIETNYSSSVVLNDKQTEALKSEKNVGVVSAIFILDRISNERESWEQNEYAASRRRLYEVLTQCYDYYITMKLGTDKLIRGEYKKALTDFCIERGYNFNSKTHDMQRIVKAVFGGSDRRRISAYAQALVAALSGGGFNDKGEAVTVMTVNLTSWIEDQGGIEEIRTGSKNIGMTRREQAQVAAKVLDESNSISTINADFKTYGLDSNDSDKQMVLVVTFRNTGKFEVNAVVKDHTAVNEALACYFKNNKLHATDAAVSGKTTQSASAE